MVRFEAITSEIPVYEKAVAEEAHARELSRRRHDTRRVNDVLHEMGMLNHASVPLDSVSDALRAHGFEPLESMILCGREGRIHESVGRNRWLTLSWYKMESGRYEVVAYVS